MTQTLSRVTTDTMQRTSIKDVSSDIAARLTRVNKSLRDGNLSASQSATVREGWSYVYKDGPVPVLGFARSGAARLDQADEGNAAIPFVITTSDEDRDGDVVVPSGCILDNYARNPLVFFGHQEWEIPIGVCRSPSDRITVAPSEDEVQATVYFDKGDSDAMFIHGKCKRKILNATSVAFVPVEAYRRHTGIEKARTHHSDNQDAASWLYKQWDMTELSIVGVPSNPWATQLQKHMRGALRDSLDKERSFISPRCYQACKQYAAVPRGKCFTGWCPQPDGTCAPCGTITKSNKSRTVAKGRVVSPNPIGPPTQSETMDRLTKATTDKFGGSAYWTKHPTDENTSQIYHLIPLPHDNVPSGVIADYLSEEHGVDAQGHTDGEHSIVNVSHATRARKSVKKANLVGHQPGDRYAVDSYEHPSGQQHHVYNTRTGHTVATHDFRHRAVEEAETLNAGSGKDKKSLSSKVAKSNVHFRSEQSEDHPDVHDMIREEVHHTGGREERRYRGGGAPVPGFNDEQSAQRRADLLNSEGAEKLRDEQREELDNEVEKKEGDHQIHHDEHGYWLSGPGVDEHVGIHPDPHGPGSRIRIHNGQNQYGPFNDEASARRTGRLHDYSDHECNNGALREHSLTASVRKGKSTPIAVGDTVAAKSDLDWENPLTGSTENFVKSGDRMKVVSQTEWNGYKCQRADGKTSSFSADEIRRVGSKTKPMTHHGHGHDVTGEARDPHGRWTFGGSGTGQAPAKSAKSCGCNNCSAGRACGCSVKKSLSEASGASGGYTVPTIKSTCKACSDSGNCSACGGDGNTKSGTCKACKGSGECQKCSREVVKQLGDTVMKGKFGKKKEDEEEDLEDADTEEDTAADDEEGEDRVTSEDDAGDDEEDSDPDDESAEADDEDEEDADVDHARGDLEEAGDDVQHAEGDLEDAEDSEDDEEGLDAEGEDTDGPDMDAEQSGIPKHSGKVMAALHGHARSESDYLNDEMGKMDNPQAKADLTKYHSKFVSPRMEHLKGMLHHHHGQDGDDPDELMDRHEQSFETDGTGGGETQPGEAGMVANGDVPPDEGYEHHEEPDGDEASEDKDGSGSRDEEETDKKPVDDGSRDEILERYKTEKGWRTRVVGHVRVAKSGLKYIVRTKGVCRVCEGSGTSSGKTCQACNGSGMHRAKTRTPKNAKKKDMSGAPAPGASPGASPAAAGPQNEVVKAAADHLDSLTEAPDIALHHHAGLRHHAEALRSLHHDLHAAHDDLMDEMDGEPNEAGDNVQPDHVQVRRKGQRTLSPAVVNRFSSLQETMRKLGVGTED